MKQNLGVLILVSISSVLILCMLAIPIDGLRKEQETAFIYWLYTMGIFTCWKWVAWGFSFIVNDMIFIYNIIMTFAWFFFNILNVLSFLCVYSLFLELNDLTKLQDMARLKMDTMSSMAPSRAASTIHGGGSRPTSPYVVNMP